MSDTNVIACDDAAPTLLAQGTAGSFFNDGPDTVFLGGDDVTVADGLPLTINSFSSFELPGGHAVYGLCDTGDDAAVRVFEVET